MADLVEDPGSSATDLTGTISDTARALFAAGNISDTLQRVVDLSVEIVEGCDFAGIFVLEGEAITTPVHMDRTVIEVDTLQHQSGEGPCLDAIAQRGIFYADDLAYDARWLRFGPKATSAGVRSALAFPLFANRTRGALNLYARYPQAFGVLDRANGQILATLADLAISVAEAHASGERRAQNLERALVTREMIGQATGILMERERITADQAFDILRRASQRLNVRLRDVAQDLVDTGEQPDSEPPAGAL